MNTHSIRSIDIESKSMKRPRQEDSESNSEKAGVTETWPRFLVISSKDPAKTFDKVSPFVVSKALKGIIGDTKDAKILRSGTVLVQCARREQSVNLLKCKMFGTIPIEVSPHNSLNFSKGVVRSYDLRNASEKEMLEELKSQHVTEVKRVFITRDGKKTQTNTFILTFDVPTLPSSVKASLYNCPVEPYVPNPLRCFNCQRFGHHKDKCGKETVCGRCGQTGHDLSSCENPLQCANCKGDHVANSKECAMWKQEKEIQALKVKNKLTFKEARKQVQSRTPGGPTAPSYAAVTRPAPAHSECSTCKLLVQHLATLFPTKANEIQKLLQTLGITSNIQKPTVVLPTQSTSSTSSPSPPPPSQAPPSKESPPGKPKDGKPGKANTKTTKANSKPASQNKDKKGTKPPKNDKPPFDKQKEGRPKLNRFAVDGDSLEVVSESPPTDDQNRFTLLGERMEDTDSSETIWGDKAPSWSTDKDSWVNSNPDIIHTSQDSVLKHK